MRAADAQVDADPTPAQKDAQNYRMGHLRWQGLDISVETPKGGTRTAKDGSWSVPDFPASYGRFKGTRGADGDHVDTFIGDDVESPRAFVIDQVDPGSGKFDEHKVMIGFGDRDAALAAYDAAFTDASGPARRGAVSDLSVEELKTWLRTGATARPFDAEALRARKQPPLERVESEVRYDEDLPADDVQARAGEEPSPPEDGDVHRPGAVSREPVIEPAKTGELKTGVEQIDSAGAAAHALASLRRSPNERFYILALDRSDRPIAVLRLSTGSVAQARVYPEIVAKAVYQTPGVAKVWLAHNHPSGAARPSYEDQQLTRNLASLFGRGTGVEVAGHVIVAGTDYVEMDATGETKGGAKIPASARTITIPITERTVRKAGSPGEKITTPNAARAALPRLAFGRPGVVFFDFQHRALGFMPMPVEEMALLRSAEEAGADSAARRFFDRAGRLNAAAVMIYAPKGVISRESFEAAANNIARAANLADLKPLDAFHGEGSLREEGRFPKLEPKEFAMGTGGRLLTEAKESSDRTERPAVGIALAPPYSGTAQGAVADTRRARPDAIRRAVRKLFRVPINEGGFKSSRDKLGIYKVKPRTIRVRNQNDIGVIAHETGHHFSETSREVRKLMRAHESELRAITPYAAGQKTAALQREEGFAEYLRLRWTQPNEARRRAPRFSAAFEAYVDAGGYRPVFDAIEGAIRDWQNLPPADRILAKVGEDEPPFRETFGVDRILFEVLDRWLPMKRMVEDLKPDIAPSADPFKLAHLLAGDAAIIEDWLLSETIPFNFTRRADPADRGKPLAAVLKPVQARQREFGAYLIAKRASELLRRGKEHLYAADEIAAGLRLETPEFKAAAEDLYAYQDQLLDYATEGGLLSAGAASGFRRYPFYVPFFRVGEPTGQRGDIFKAIKGGTENLRDPIANIIENTVRVIHATNRNFVLAKAHDLARAVPGGGRWLEDVPMPERAVKVETQKIIEALREQGVEIDLEAAEAVATSQTFFVKNPFGDDRQRIIVVRRRGEPHALQVNDELLWRALERFEPVDMGFIEKLLAVPADVLRAGIVLSPDFMARNFARDTLSGFLQSKRGILPVIGTVEGFKEIATRSDAARLYRAFGGAYGDMWRADRGLERHLVERMARRGGFDPRSIVTPRGLIALLHRIGSVAEAGTRVAEFKKTMDGGDIDSLIDAAYNAREVSVDFGMHGHSRSVRFLTRITPFLNPALQGWYKAARTARSAPLTTLMRGGVLAAASIGLFLANRDEDWYEDIEQWEKNTYWHLDVGLTDAQGEVIPLRIPKPFEWGGIFGSIPEALAQVAIDQHGRRFAKRLESIVDDVFMLRAIPTALLVPAELWANKNQFTGRPIVPESKERLAPELQATAATSLTARKAGELAGEAPAKIDHAIRGFFGTLGTYSVMLADQAIRFTGDEAPALPSPWQRTPVVRVFFSDPSGANSRYVAEFYELLREARQADATARRLSGDAASAYADRHADKIASLRSATKLARELGALRRDNERLRESAELPAEVRAQLIAENDQMIRWLARDYMRTSSPDALKVERNEPAKPTAPAPSTHQKQSGNALLHEISKGLPRQEAR